MSMIKDAHMLSSARGSAMIESLLAMFLLSVALLGAATVQVNSMRQANSVTAQTLADMQARKMLEAMRVNSAGVIAGSYDSVSSTVTSPGCISSGCTTGADIAKTDINKWYAELAGLPSGTGSIARVGVSNIFYVTVGWLDPNNQTTQSWILKSAVP